MSSPAEENQPQHPFIPDAFFTAQAQAEEIEVLLQEIHELKKKYSARVGYLSALAKQIQAEANHQIGVLRGENENLMAELEKHCKATFANSMKNAGEDSGPADSAVDPDALPTSS